MKCSWGIQHRAQQTVSADDCRGDPCTLNMGLGVGAGFCIDGSVELGTSLPPLWAAHQEEMMATWMPVCVNVEEKRCTEIIAKVSVKPCSEVSRCLVMAEGSTKKGNLVRGLY